MGWKDTQTKKSTHISKMDDGIPEAAWGEVFDTEFLDVFSDIERGGRKESPGQKEGGGDLSRGTVSGWSNLEERKGRVGWENGIVEKDFIEWRAGEKRYTLSPKG